MKLLLLMTTMMMTSALWAETTTLNNPSEKLGVSNNGEMSGTKHSEDGVNKVGMPPVKSREQPTGPTTERSIRTMDCKDQNGVVFPVDKPGYKECMNKMKK